jgi:enoyl-CoA hydratase/carnithine racemase
VSATTVGDVHIIDLGNGDNRLTDDVLDEFHRLLDDLEHGVGARSLVTRGSGKVWSNELGMDLSPGEHMLVAERLLPQTRNRALLRGRRFTAAEALAEHDRTTGQ